LERRARDSGLGLSLPISRVYHFSPLCNHTRQRTRGLAGEDEKGKTLALPLFIRPSDRSLREKNRALWWLN